MATDIVDMVIDALAADITAEVKNGVPVDDMSRAGEVKAGRLQSDPTDPINSVEIHPNYPPNREGWSHIYAKSQSNQASEFLKYGAPTIGGAGEIGGGMWWWRRGSCQLRCFYTSQDLTRSEARQHANLFRRRVEDAIYQAPTVLALSADSFGETVGHIIRPTESFLVEGGGPPNSWLWQGWVKWEVLTSVNS